MPVINRNGKAYDSGDVVVTMFGRNDYEITEISYSTEQEHQPNHSLGSNDSTSYSMGKKTNSATITFRLASMSIIEKAAGGNILRIKPFTINVTILNEDNDIINDTIVAKFQSQGRDISGDMDLKKQCTLFVLSINFNNA